MAEEVEFLLDNYQDFEIAQRYLFEEYGILGLEEDLVLEDLNKDQEEKKKTIGQKAKEHFKKHWKKYALGAGAGLVATGAGHQLYNRSKAKEYQKQADRIENHHFWGNDIDIAGINKIENGDKYSDLVKKVQKHNKWLLKPFKVKSKEHTDYKIVK